MATKNQKLQNILRLYKRTTGKTEVVMRSVAEFAAQMGMKLPKQPDPLDMLAHEFAVAAREEYRTDRATGKRYRANHVYPAHVNGKQMSLWIDIDEAPRKPILKSFSKRRDQMVDDGVQLSLDIDHWNHVNPTEESIVVDLDLNDPIEWRKNAPLDEMKKAS